MPTLVPATLNTGTLPVPQSTGNTLPASRVDAAIIRAPSTSDLDLGARARAHSLALLHMCTYVSHYVRGQVQILQRLRKMLYQVSE